MGMESQDDGMGDGGIRVEGSEGAGVESEGGEGGGSVGASIESGGSEGGGGEGGGGGKDGGGEQVPHEAINLGRTDSSVGKSVCWLACILNFCQYQHFPLISGTSFNSSTLSFPNSLFLS